MIVVLHDFPIDDHVVLHIKGYNFGLAKLDTPARSHITCTDVVVPYYLAEVSTSNKGVCGNTYFFYFSA